MGQTCSDIPRLKPCEDCAVLVVRDPCNLFPTGPIPDQGQVLPIPDLADQGQIKARPEQAQIKETPEEAEEEVDLTRVESWQAPYRDPLLKRPLLRRESSLRAGQAAPEYTTKFPPLLQMPGPRLWTCLTLLGTALALCLTCFRPWLEEHGLPAGKLLGYVSIPILSTLFTYFHIWLALYMTFYPLAYMGCLQIPDTNVGCGWQGIIPSKAGKMARTSVELMTAKLIRVQDIVERIDAQVVVQELEPILPKTLSSVIQDALKQEEPKIWGRLPERVKKELVQRADKDSAAIVRNLVQDLKNKIERVFDLAGMVEGAFIKEPALLNHMFISCGYDELVFIRDFGAYMGGAFGVVQVALWISNPLGWTLPTFGFVVGILTNWLALKMIFEPVEPVRICGLELHGLFLRRQKQVSEVYAQIVADNILYARSIISAILTGSWSDQLFKVLHKHVSIATDGYIGGADRLVKFFRDEAQIKRMKQVVAEVVLQRLPQDTKHVEKYMDEAMGLEDVLREKLQSLPYADFEGLLHPVFQEDEWKLVLMGGVLGIFIGCMQWKFLGS